MNCQYNQVLSLYRTLIRRGYNLRLTDKNFYFTRIRREFEKNRNLTSETEIQNGIEKGEELIKQNAIV